IGNGSSQAFFAVNAGESATLVMSYGPAHKPPPPPIDAYAALRSTQEFWRNWISRFDDSRTTWPGAVRRSLLTLKALTHGRSGAIVAAPTTSLPEAPAGQLNWDYRY